jgi:predicted SAM-dependent methyltransferase
MRLNLGCGNDYRNGWVNVDLYNKFVDLRFDIEKAPYPLESDSVDEVYCAQVLEHLRYPEIAIAEIYRIMKPGAIATLIVPHYTTAGDHNFRHHSHFATCAIHDFTDGNEAQNELAMHGTFKLISAVRKMRGLHINVGGWKGKYLFDFVPIWDSIIWKVRK